MLARRVGERGRRRASQGNCGGQGRDGGADGDPGTAGGPAPRWPGPGGCPGISPRVRAAGSGPGGGGTLALTEIRFPAPFHARQFRDRSRSRRSSTPPHAGTAAATRASRVIRRNTNRRHMIGGHHGRSAGRATLLVRAADGIPGTHSTGPGPVAAGAGIVATLAANVAHGWSHGPVGAAVAAWPAASLVGSYELLLWLIRTAADDVAREPGADRASGPADHPAGTLPLVSAPDPDAAGHQDGGDDRATAGAAGGRYLAPAPGADPGGGPDRLTADHTYRSAAQERTGWSVANSFSAVGEDGQEDANGAAAGAAVRLRRDPQASANWPNPGCAPSARLRRWPVAAATGQGRRRPGPWRSRRRGH